ncbi:hypothetical protein LCGC14_1653810 [marine sediment metagenome]|uniref:Tyr recombinase domain-containing protein n=1 Tax=marine sediment metagenome TaxID=412755 RepID=A0A0F9KBZ5_9ZZZZ
MAKNDIYNNQKRYEYFTGHIEDYLKEPDKTTNRGRKRKYTIKNKINIKHFKSIFNIFEARDNSFIRRLRLSRVLLMVCYVLDKDLAEATREDINKVMAYSHTANKSVKSKKDFVVDIKYLWRQLAPEKDEKGRIDDTITPYAVRHLSSKIDKSKEKLRGDKFSLDEFKRLVQSLGSDVRLQALLTLSFESLGRPQEILQTKIKDVKLYDNYGKVYISEFGKEGTGFLRVVDSYFYLSKWLNEHPLKDDPEAYFFINMGRTNRYKQLKPYSVNKTIRERCKALKKNKPITNHCINNAKLILSINNVKSILSLTSFVLFGFHALLWFESIIYSTISNNRTFKYWFFSFKNWSFIMSFLRFSTILTNFIVVFI